MPMALGSSPHQLEPTLSEGERERHSLDRGHGTHAGDLGASSGVGRRAGAARACLLIALVIHTRRLAPAVWNCQRRCE